MDIVNFSSKASIKPELGGIAFYGNRTVATNSFLLFEVKAEGERLEEPVLLDAKDVKQRVRLGKDDKVTLDLLEHEYGLKPVEATYPEVDRIIDPAFSQEDYVEVSINGEYLAQIAKILSK